MALDPSTHGRGISTLWPFGLGDTFSRAMALVDTLSVRHIETKCKRDMAPTAMDSPNAHFTKVFSISVYVQRFPEKRCRVSHNRPQISIYSHQVGIRPRQRL